MPTCELCNGPVPIESWRFCSQSCRAKHNGKNGWGKTNQGHTKTCENCGKVFAIPRNRIATARACSRLCLGKIQSRERKGVFGVGENNPTWKGGIQTYRQYKKPACERCGATQPLCVHHKDRNRYNNELDNLETLCRSCHAIEHDVGSWAPKGPQGPRTRFPQPCERCGEMFVRVNVGQRYCSRQCWLKVLNDRRAAA